MEVVVLFAFFLTFTAAQQSQLEGPQNTLSVVGSNVTLECLSPYRNCSGLDWMKYVPGTDPVNIFRYTAGIMYADKNRYSVDNSSGCDLVIKNVELSDAGRFICRAMTSSSTVDRSASLNILKSKPKCSVNASLVDILEGDGIQLTCEVIYNETEKVSMLWKGVEDAPAALEIGGTIIRSYSFGASVPEVPSFTCATSFQVKDVGIEIIGFASNIPTATCETPTIKVLYSVRHVNLSPSFAVYSPGTNITCTAAGYPTPTFKWQMLVSKINATWQDISNATWQDIPNATHDVFTQYNVSVSRYRCVATNVVRGELYTAISTAFQIQQSDSIASKEAFVAIGVGSGLIVALALAFAAILILVRLRRLEYHRSVTTPSLDVAQPLESGESLSFHGTMATLLASDDAADKTEQTSLALLPPNTTRRASSAAQRESYYANWGDTTANYEPVQRKDENKPQAGQGESTYASLGDKREDHNYTSFKEN